MKQQRPSLGLLKTNPEANFTLEIVKGVKAHTDAGAKSMALFQCLCDQVKA